MRQLPAWCLKADPLLLIVLAAFVLRLAVSWHPGYTFDIGVYQGWARSGVEYGVAESYSRQVGEIMLPDYPPLAITIFTAFGHVYKALFTEFDMQSVGFRMYMKLPAIFSDLAICWMLYALLSRFKGKRAGIVGGLAYALNPASVYVTAYWGQTDAVYTAFLLAALTAWVYRKEHLAAVMLACSVLFKVQGVVLFPLFAFLVADDPRRLLRFLITGILTFIVILIPYALGGALQEVSNIYTGAVGRYGNVAIGAYNFWWSILADKAWQVDSGDSPFGLMSYTKWGFLLFGFLYAGILWIFRKELRKPLNFEPLLYCAALLAAAFFLFLTQMHERYLFPFVALGVPLISISKKVAAAYWGIVAAFVVNLMGILPLSAIDRAVYLQLDALDIFVACTQVWLFIFLVITAYERYAPKRS